MKTVTGIQQSKVMMAFIIKYDVYDITLNTSVVTDR